MGGDDAVELYNNSTPLDVIGVPGEDPGAGWAVGGVEEATKNHTLVRKPNISQGNTNWNESAGDEDYSEWYVYENGNYTFECYKTSVTRTLEKLIYFKECFIKYIVLKTLCLILIFFRIRHVFFNH